MEVNDLPPPMPIAATGPVRVELKLGSGECHSKGCREGEQHRKCWITIKYPADAKLSCRRRCLQFLLHTSGVSNHQNAEGRNLRSGKPGGKS